MTTSYRRAARLALAPALLASSANGIPVDQALLEDMIPTTSSLCTDPGTTTHSFTLSSPSSASGWDPSNSQYEAETFLAETTHTDPSGPSRSWTMRFGKGGNVYSLVGPYGEAVPPQSAAHSAWVEDLVCSATAKDLSKGTAEDPYSIFMGGTYMGNDTDGRSFDSPDYTPPAFYSPTLAAKCGGGGCSFASWGQQAYIPTAHTSDLLLLTRYRNCGDGAIEFTQVFHNDADALISTDTLDSLHAPWGGVRRSTFPDLILSEGSGDMELDRPASSAGKAVDMDVTGGYTTFRHISSEELVEYALPCHNGTHVKYECDDAQSNSEGYSPLRLVLQGNDTCAFTQGHSDSHGALYPHINPYVVHCDTNVPGAVPKMDYNLQPGTCGACDLVFVNSRTSQSVEVDFVVHWNWQNPGRSYFALKNTTAEDMNGMFVQGDEIVVKVKKAMADDPSLTYVHGKGVEFTDPGNSWVEAGGRLLYGRAPRDYTQLAVSARVTLDPGSTYVTRQFLLTDTLDLVPNRTSALVDEAYSDMLYYDDFTGRTVELFEDSASSTFGAAASDSVGGTFVYCKQGVSKCVGSTTPKSGFGAYFAITCGTSTYFGPDKYHFAVKGTAAGDPVRPYACVGEDPSVRPTFDLLGYFPLGDGGCGALENHSYDADLCDTAGAPPASGAVSVDEAILSDAIPPGGSSSCDVDHGTTSVSFTFSSSTESEWASINAQYESDTFLAEMTHADAVDSSRSWRMRIGKGGNVYSFLGPYGEAVAPQGKEYSPWVDEVGSMGVAVCMANNDASNDADLAGPPYHKYFIHQAGTYMKTRPRKNAVLSNGTVVPLFYLNYDYPDYTPPAFYSPDLATHCEGNVCSFASWGQQAHIPSAHKSDLIYMNRYRNCGDGVVEYTQVFQNNGDPDSGDRLDYLNVPWGGVRRSTFPLVSQADTNQALQLNDQAFNGVDENIPDLDETGGFTTFHNVEEETLTLFSMPCHNGTNSKAAPCDDVQSKTDGYAPLDLIIQGDNPCSFTQGHSDTHGMYVVRCDTSSIGSVPQIDASTIPGLCGECTLYFVNERTMAYVTVKRVIHWNWPNNGKSYFGIEGRDAEDMNAIFKSGDRMVVVMDEPPRLRLHNMPCHDGTNPKATCDDAQSIASGYQPLDLTLQSDDSCEYMSSHSSSFGRYIVRCATNLPASAVPRIDYAVVPGVCGDCHLLFVNERTGAFVTVPFVVHWNWHSIGYAYFALEGHTAEDMNAMFRAGDSIVVKEVNQLPNRYGMPCHNGMHSLSVCYDPADVGAGHGELELVMKQDSCWHSQGHSDATSEYIIVCQLNERESAPSFPDPITFDPPLYFVNERTLSYVNVTYVHHWNWWRNGNSYFGISGNDISDFNAMFDKDDRIVVLTQPPIWNGPPVNDASLTFVHGVGVEYDDMGNDWFNQRGRVRQGYSDSKKRDYSVFTVNAQVDLDGGLTYVNRQYILSDTVDNVERRAPSYVDEAHGDMLSPNDFTGRVIEIYSSASDNSTFGAAASQQLGGTATACAQGVSMCVGSSTPQAGFRAFFAITCGTDSYFGPDQYHFAPPDAGDGIVRAYACAGEDTSVRPTFKLLGYFSVSDGGACVSLRDSAYDPDFCTTPP